MKYKNIFLVMCMFLCTLTPCKAKMNTSIMIASKQLPYIMYVEIKDEKHMHVRFISRDMILPLRCKETAMPIKKVDLKKDFSCVSNSIEDFYHLKSKHWVYVHVNRIAHALDLPYQHTDFQTLSGLCDYFANVVKHLNLSMLLHYHDYIESDMDISDYYDLYHMFKGKKVHITFSYAKEIYAGSYTLPMDHKFYERK